ncbi:MAG: hypothetical protein V3V16_14855 [Melioribacteraceae bacterium]
MKTKYISCLLLLIIISLPTSLSAQLLNPKYFGIKLGYHLGYNTFGDSGGGSHNEIDSYVHTMSERLDGLSVALFYQERMSDYSFFIFELSLIYSGFREKLSLSNYNLGKYSSNKYVFNERTFYLSAGTSINLLLTKKIFRPYIFGGINLNYLLSTNSNKSQIIQSEIYETQNESISYKGSGYVNPNMSLIFGIGLTPYTNEIIELSFELKYNLDVTRRFRISMLRNEIDNFIQVGNKDFFYNSLEFLTKINF